MANSEQPDGLSGLFRGPAAAKSLYSLCYYVSFGAVYASCLALEMIPPDSIMRHGLRDGAEAARQAWAGTHEEDATAESEMELPDAPEDTAAGA